MRNIVFIFILIHSISFSQNKFTVYFDTDSHQLQLSELNKLDNVSDMETENQVVSEYEGGNIDIDWEAL